VRTWSGRAFQVAGLRWKHKHKLLYAVRLVYLAECTKLLYKHIHTNLHGAKNRENKSEALDDKTVKADWKRWNLGG